MRRVFIPNRGEIAVRVIRALHENDVEAVAVYSTADADSLHVRLADRAVRVGPPAAAESYLKIPSLIAAATTTVSPGCGLPIASSPAYAVKPGMPSTPSDVETGTTDGSSLRSP